MLVMRNRWLVTPGPSHSIGVTILKGKGGTGKVDQEELLQRPKKFHPSRVPDWMILLLFCGLFLAQTVLSVRQESATFDETDHLPAGYVYWRLGDYGVMPEHPPFIKMLASIPLLLVDVKMPRLPSHISVQEDFLFGRRFLYETNDGDRLLFLGRMAVLPLGLLLGCAVFLWAKHLFGRGGAMFALLLYTFEPNLLAHAPLVALDFGAACFIFLTVYMFWRLVRRVSIPCLLGAGATLGLALITKLSAAPLLLVLLLLSITMVLVPQPVGLHLPGVWQNHASTRARKLVILLTALVIMGLLAYGTIWAAYQFRYQGVTMRERPILIPWDQIPERSWTAQAFSVMREMKVLPEPYLYGMAFVLKKMTRLTFLMGEVSTHGWWYYFVITFLLKTPLPLLLFLALCPLALRKVWRGNRMGILFLLVPVLVYFCIASASRLNIGHRHILPIYPFLIVMAGSLVPWATSRRALVRGGLAALGVWYIFSSVSIFPHYLAYFNELAGGPDGGYRYLVDSNLDWGQDLKGLKRYMDAHQIPRVWLSYFGTASPAYYRIAYNSLPSYPYIFKPDTEPTPFVAISATNLQGVYLENRNIFKEFRQRQPVAKIGYSIFIYRLE